MPSWLAMIFTASLLAPTVPSEPMPLHSKNERQASQGAMKLQCHTGGCMIADSRLARSVLICTQQTTVAQASSRSGGSGWPANTPELALGDALGQGLGLRAVRQGGEGHVVHNACRGGGRSGWRQRLSTTQGQEAGCCCKQGWCASALPRSSVSGCHKGVTNCSQKQPSPAQLSLPLTHAEVVAHVLDVRLHQVLIHRQRPGARQG